jgi:hypothetical protein
VASWSRPGCRCGWGQRGAERVEGGGGLLLGAAEAAARLEAAGEAAALEQHGVGLPREAGRNGGEAVQEERVDPEELVGGAPIRARAGERREELERAAEEREEALGEGAEAGGDRGGRGILV